MYAVGRIGSYISQGVYTVSAPFHPFGGAVDIIVVEQTDGSFKSSPWYVRFGKFQGVLKTKEKVVSINVNGVDANFNMYLDHKGEAYFLKEADIEGEYASYPSSSGDEADGKSNCSRRSMKSKSCNDDADKLNSVAQVDASNGKILARTASQRARILGHFLGRKSFKEGRYREGACNIDMVRLSSLERAEIAADLLEVNWSTNLSSSKSRKENVSRSLAHDVLEDKADKDIQDDEETHVELSVHDDEQNGDDRPILDKESGSYNEQMASDSHLNSENLESSVEEASIDISCLVVESSALDESILEENSAMVSNLSRTIDEFGVGNAHLDEHEHHACPDSKIQYELEACHGKQFDGGQAFDKNEVGLSGCRISTETGSEQSFICRETSKTSIVGLDGTNENTPMDEFGGVNNYLDEHEHQACPDSKIQYELEACHGKHFDGDQAFDKNEVGLSGSRISSETGTERVQSFIYCETSKSSIVGLDGTDEKTQETLYLASGGCGEVHVQLETLHVTTELLPKDRDVEQAKDIKLEREPVEVSENHSDQVSQAPCMLEYNETELEKPPEVPEFSTQVVSVEPALCSMKEVNSQNRCTIPDEVQEDIDITYGLHQYLESTGDSQELYIDSVLKKAVGNSPSEISEEEQFLFSDLDELKLSKVQGVDSSSPDSVKICDHPAFSAEGIKEIDGSINKNDESSSSSDLFGQYSPLNDIENSTEKLRAISNPIIIHKSHLAAEEVGRLVESLPIMISTVKLDARDPRHPLSHSLDSKSKSLNWTLFKENDSCCMKTDTDGEQHLAEEQPYIADTQISQEQKAYLSNPAAGDPAKPIVPPGGSWRLWPFFTRSRSGKAMKPVLSDAKRSDAEVASKNINERDETKSVCKAKVVKKKLRVLIPTSEQLSSLNLKEGKNIVTFTFSTPMLGKQQVDARIYLWKWNTRIVISDVDGTITRSDVLGQFMPMVGVDWSQTGVAHLFSAIKENGYQLLFLSARAISQAYHTRRFLFNLKQDGKALPDGPVVISPDGLFPSLFREVIRRAPHEFKIACLEDIKALFPSDCNPYPFYAGFGNRDTDEISYLKVGIPRGKIFIINPKGEVVVNRRVDSKTYSSLHTLVHGMFPLTTSTEQEDFNQWNYWKVPPPNIDV